MTYPHRSSSTSALAKRDSSRSKPSTVMAGKLMTGSRPSSQGSTRDSSGSPRSTAGLFTEGELLAQRAAVCERLGAKGFMRSADDLFKHGRAYNGPDTTPPRCIWESKQKPRDDHGCPDWLTASEFEDVPAVRAAKCRQLATLMKLSRKTVLYTGAGISASVIGQAARSGQNKVGWKGNTRTVDPTPTHRALGFLGRQGLIHGWVQQNHDGLPQKAGFPQECINEVHGSWYDPSNPVVKYSGSLHERCYPWMVEDGETADLVIVLGTSLGGLNADQVATSTAERSLVGASLGTVCINLQQTPQDSKMSLRLFGKSDALLPLLVRELGFGGMKFDRPQPQVWPKESRALVPYDADGQLIPAGAGPRQMMWLDLNERQRVRISPGHNIQGAKQPQYMHIGASKPYKMKDGQVREPGVGLGSVVRRDEASSRFILQIEGQEMSLGLWWLEAAIRGAVPVLPVVNQEPKFQTESAAGEGEPPSHRANLRAPARGTSRATSSPASSRKSSK